MNTRSTILLALTLTMLGACDRGSTVDATEAHRSAEPEAAPAAEEATQAPSDAAPSLQLSLGDDWRASVTEGAARLQAADPQRFETLSSMAPRTTRAGTPRFTGPLVRDSQAAVVFLQRLTAGDESPPVRAALVEALPRTGASFGPALVDLLASESDGHVRAEMVTALRTADATSALEGLAQGFDDADARVRLAAARTSARRTDGVELADALVSAVADADAGVKLEAMRSLGALGVESATATLEAELGSSSADVRLAAVRALGRIDATGTAASSKVQALAHDADPRVAKAVAKLVAP